VLFQFNTYIYIVWVTVGIVCVLNFVVCLLCHFKNFMLVQVSVICQCLTLFVLHFGVSAWCLKCPKHIDSNCDVFQSRIYVSTEDRRAREIR
jgi:hypothetical protein